MTESDYKHGLRIVVFNRQRGLCAYCHEPMDIHNFHLSHLVANTKARRKAYGWRVLWSPEIVAATHPTDTCNSGMLVGRGLEEERVIQRAIEEAKGAIDE